MTIQNLAPAGSPVARVARPDGYGDAEIKLIGGWLTDGFTADRIAGLLSEHRGRFVSRSAIVGIVHRNKELKAIGFQRRGTGGLRAGRAVTRLPDRAPPRFSEPRGVTLRSAAAAVEGRDTPLPADALPATLAELEARQCRFPASGEGASMLYCAAAVDDWQPGTCGGSYCRFHRSVALNGFISARAA